MHSPIQDQVPVGGVGSSLQATPSLPLPVSCSYSHHKYSYVPQSGKTWPG